MANTTESTSAPNRDSIRNKIFSQKNTELKKIPVPFNGEILEFRQPSIEMIASLRDSGSEDSNFLAVCLINFCFIPETDIKVFDESDYDRILKMPYGQSWNAAVTAISEVLDLRVEEKVKN